MARLIDADALKGMFRGTTVNVSGVRCGKAVLFAIEKATNEYISKVIDEAPTIEAEPVRHGHWIENPTEYYKEWIKVFGNDRFFAECEYFTDHIACSNCLKKYNYIDNDSTDEWNYCSNCGAKMDKEE